MDIKLVWHGQRIAKMSNVINGQVHNAQKESVES